MINKRIDLTAGFWWAVLLLLIVWVTDNHVIRLILSLPLMCFLTGHTVLRAIKPLSTTHRADRADADQTAGPLEHSVFSAGVSIAVCVGGGFLLNMISMLNPVGWAIWLIVVNGFAVLIALRQPYEPFILPELSRIRVWHVITFCAAIGVTVGSYVLAVYVIDTYHEFKYTEFWLAPEPSPGKVALGVRSQETEPEQYEIEVTADKTLIAVFRVIELAPGEKWVRELTVGLNQKRVEAKLYRTRDHALYRKVSALTQ
jgi:uncharacterized membrane protein